MGAISSVSFSFLANIFFQNGTDSFLVMGTGGAGAGITVFACGAGVNGFAPYAVARGAGALEDETVFAVEAFVAVEFVGGNGALAFVFVRITGAGSIVLGVDAGHAAGLVNVGAGGRGAPSAGFDVFITGTGFFLSNVASPR